MYTFLLGMITGYITCYHRNGILTFGLNTYMYLCPRRHDIYHLIPIKMNMIVSNGNSFYEYKINDREYLSIDNTIIKINNKSSPLNIRIINITYHDSYKHLDDIQHKEEVFNDIQKFAGYNGNFHSNTGKFNIKHIYDYTNKALYRDIIASILVENDYAECTIIE